MRGNIRRKKYKKIILNLFFLFVGVGFLTTGGVIISVGAAKIPDFSSFEERKVSRSTKIYDQTGEIILYDIHKDIKRTIAPFNEMGSHIKNAVVAIEDTTFFQHKGIRPKAILRAIWVNLAKGSLSQGGSTITQQVVKNTLLTQERTITRKLKELILSLKIEQVMSKEDILGIYLNEAPYGGNIYGIKEASLSFFGKEPTDLTLAEAAYLAAIPNAPTYYSPYGENKDKLDIRKNVVLSRMKELGLITEDEYVEAFAEEVLFLPRAQFGIKAPHFVLYVRQYLEQRYGKDVVENGGLSVYTTLNYELQEVAERVVYKHALQNEELYDASNAGLVAIDPRTGHILVMVGSRNYFDKEIDGNFNVATASRQPGSAFKPFVYATAFTKGYTPDTVLFDLKTEFQAGCDAYGRAQSGTNQNDCYSPRNYDDKFLGPVTVREALAQSRNLPSVKFLYLAGLTDSLRTARNMGIKTLRSADFYGLTLVLGGGEVKLLEMVSSYGVFATGGEYHPYQSIIRVEDADGNILEEYKDRPVNALDKNAALLVTDILSDNEARTPLFGANSFMYFPGRDVAGKTGTTNNNRDAWMLGYTPSLVAGVWSGNNDNTPMKKGSSISGRLWKAFMDEALTKLPVEYFEDPIIEYSENTKPVIRGFWSGGESYIIDTVSNKLATEYTPNETKKEVIVTNVHSILYWVDKNDPTGDIPGDMENEDNQYERWDLIVQDWWLRNPGSVEVVEQGDIPEEYDDVHIPENFPVITIMSPEITDEFGVGDQITLSIDITGVYDLQKMDVFVNNKYLGSVKTAPFNFSFTAEEVENIEKLNKIKVVGYDTVFNRGEAILEFVVNI